MEQGWQAHRAHRHPAHRRRTGPGRRIGRAPGLAALCARARQSVDARTRNLRPVRAGRARTGALRADGVGLRRLRWPHHPTDPGHSARLGFVARRLSRRRERHAGGRAGRPGDRRTGRHRRRRRHLLPRPHAARVWRPLGHAGPRAGRATRACPRRRSAYSATSATQPCWLAGTTRAQAACNGRAPIRDRHASSTKVQHRHGGTF